MVMAVLCVSEDIWPDWERKDGEPEPDWVTSERDQFFNNRDSDKDKRLSKVSFVCTIWLYLTIDITLGSFYLLHFIFCLLQRELEEWIAPDGFDPAEAESRHLIYNADQNKVCTCIILKSDHIPYK